MIDPKALDALYATLGDIQAANQPVEIIEKQQKAPPQKDVLVEELGDTYTKMAAENEPMTFTENIDKPQVKQEFLADAPSFMELLPKEERIDESKFQQKVVLDTDGVYRLKTLPIEENVKTNVDILKEQIGVEQGLLEKPVEDFGGVTLGMQGAKQRELDDTIADKVPTESEVKNMKQAEKMIQDIEREKQKSEEEQPKAETTGTTYTASSLYDGLKSKDETVREAANKYLYNKGITRTEWDGQEPRFDFVGYASGLDSSAFGPGQIVYTTAQKMLDKGFIKDKEAQKFAKKMIAAQKLFKNMYDNKKKFDDYRPEKASNTKKAEGYLKDLGITRDKFLEYTKQGYFYPSNSKEAKKRIANGIPEGIPLEILGDNYKENYFKIYRAVIEEKLPRTKDLNDLLQDYHGGSDEADKAYSKKTQGFLNLMEE